MKLSQLAILGILLLPAGALAATKTYTVGSFDRIDVSAGIIVDAKVGQAQSVIAETSASNFDDLLIEVDNGVLEIGRPPGDWLSWGPRPEYKVHVMVPALHGVGVSSSGSAAIAGPITGDAFLAASSSGRLQADEVRGGSVAVHVSSSGMIDVAALQAGPLALDASSSGYVAVRGSRAGQVTAEASSSGGIEAAGTCDSLAVSASSSGRVLAAGLQCADVVAHASSGGSIAAFASKSVAGHASSGGRIDIGGKPGSVQVDQSSGGSINVGS